MIRRKPLLFALMLLTAFTVSMAKSDPPRRAYRSYGSYPHVYVQRQHLSNGFGLRRTPYTGLGFDGMGVSFGYPYRYGPGYGVGWGFASGAWINTYPWWGVSSGYFGYSGFTPDYSNYYGTSIDTVPSGPDIDNNSVDETLLSQPTTRFVPSNRARVTAKPESREWLPIATTEKDIPQADAADTLRSLRYQTEGDLLFRKQDYMNAYLMYSRAAVMDESRSEPRWRMGLALAATEQWQRSLRELRHALSLDPDLSKDSETLDSLFGENNASAKSELIARTRRWTELNLQDADRLFLLGVILHLDDQLQSAATLFQQAALVDPNDPYISLFVSKEIDDPGLKLVGSRKSRSKLVPPPPLPGEELDVTESKSDAPDDAVEAARPTPPRPLPSSKLIEGPNFPAAD